MDEAEMGSVLKQRLKNLCCSNGWSYGVFWRFDQRNSMLLTMEDAYYEEQMGPLVDTMLLKSHILGEGIIGQAALTGRPQWIFSDCHGKCWGCTENQDIFRDKSEFQNQFSFGIKTIAIISVEAQGVFEFGSKQKIMGRLEFLEETKKSFYAMESFHQLIPFENATSNLDGFFASLASSGDFDNESLTTEKGGCFREPGGRLCSATNLTESSCFMHDIQDQGITSQLQDLSHLKSQLQTSSIEAQMLSYGKAAPANRFGADSTSTSTWSNEGSILTSIGIQLPYERESWDSLNDFQGVSTLMVDRFGETTEDRRPFGSNGGLLDSVINLHQVPGGFLPAEFTTGFSNSLTLDDLSQWFAPLPHYNVDGARDTVTSDLSSVLAGGDTVIAVPVRQTANSSQTSITDAFISNVEKSTNIHDGNNLFDGARPDFGFGKAGECLEDIVTPLLHGDNSTVMSGMSELDVRSMSGKRKGLFSELGLEELLDGVNNSYATKSSQAGLCVDDSYSVNAAPPVVATSKKPTRKRAKPGENTRPRPKDRQLIQDRIKELRGIIPHNGKQLSIDVLLERTIKYLLFLQGVTKYADKIKQADEPKLIGQENAMLAKQNQMSGGATWAYEVGAQTIPIVVKDLNPPGQMLIEMLCEDRGFFLEIADVIRGFGLNILKGVMEVQEDKIWARFMVEAKQQVERTDIIWSLLLLLQQTDTSGIDSANQPSKAIDDGVSLSPNYQKPLLLPPFNVANN